MPALIPRILLNLLWLLTLFSTLLIAQPDPDEVFRLLDLNFPGLEKVKTAYQNGDLIAAKSELLDYYRDRTKRQLLASISGPQYDRERADRNTNNVFLIKSSLHDFGEKIDWTLVHADKEWQFSLARMNWFANLVGAYQHTQDEKYVRAWRRQIESWMELGDPGYPRTLDTGRRLENWVTSYWRFVHELKSPSVTPDFNARMLVSMAQQAEFLYAPNHWRRYSNWGSFENAGLSKLVILFPEFKRSEDWLREIYFRMRCQLSESYHADGVHVEVSPSYHSHELQVWHEFVALAKANSVESPWHAQIPLPPLAELFLPPARALMHLYKPTGVMPQVGDTDERDERDFLRELGRFWQRPEFIYVATNGKAGRPPPRTSVAFPEGGYFIMRSGWGEGALPFAEELYLLFDCGSNSPWHAHYDMLNIVATAYGHDLLKDPGRFTYNNGEDRDYFKSTAAHNTIVIDGLDQPAQFTPAAAEWHSTMGFDYVVGTQDSHPRVSHQRSVFFVKPVYWIVVDRLTGSGNHRYDQYWHLSEQALHQVRLLDSGHKVRASHLWLFSPKHNVEARLESGFLSYRYRQKVEAPVLRYSLQGEPPVVWPTVLYPFKTEAPELTVEILQPEATAGTVDSCGAIALRISSVAGTDFFFEQERAGHPCKGRDFRTDAKMAFIRSDSQGGTIRYHLVSGSYLEYRGRRLARIDGSELEVSVQPARVEIAGKCVHDFDLNVQDTPAVFLNGQEIEVERNAEGIRFVRPANH